MPENKTSYATNCFNCAYLKDRSVPVSRGNGFITLEDQRYCSKVKESDFIRFMEATCSGGDMRCKESLMDF